MKDHNAGITRLARPRIMFPAKPDLKRLMREGGGVVHDYYRFGAENFAADLYRSLDEGNSVREFTSEYWTSRYKELKEETSEYDRTRIAALKLLRHAFTGEDDASSQDILDSVRNLLQQHPRIWASTIKELQGQERETARRLYPLVFSKEMERAKVRMWCRDGEWLPVIWCPNMKTAMYAYAAFNGVETCLNCQRLFCMDVPRVDDSRSEKYCTVACGQRFRQRIYRKRQAEEGEGKSR